MDQEQGNKLQSKTPLKQGDNQKKDKQLNTYARFSSIAIQMLAIIGIGTFVGIKLDESYPNNYNVYTISLSLASVILSMIYVIRRIIATSKES